MNNQLTKSDLNGAQDSRPLNFHKITFNLDQISEGLQRFGKSYVTKSLRFYFSKEQVGEILQKVKEYDTYTIQLN